MQRIAVVVSQGQSHSPAKRQLEEELITRLMIEPGIDVMVIPHLYDLTPDGTGVLALQGISGPLVVLSWLYPRAARWLLDQNSVHGQEGDTLLKPAGDDEEEEQQEVDQLQAARDDPARVIDARDIPARRIYCIDLRSDTSADVFVREVTRIAHEHRQQVVSLDDLAGGGVSAESLRRYAQPTNDTALDAKGKLEQPATPAGPAAGSSPGLVGQSAPGQLRRIDETPTRRWYPVIDFSRCTNCMECIDFCLFGVYGVDGQETILVEQPDNCRKGCPACSRVCPENAIIFPQHKSPAIAGAAGVVAGLKIDLSKLFGAPEEGQDALEVAARERDEQLVIAGRDAVGMRVGIPKRQAERPDEPKDELDSLLDELDQLDV